MYHCLSPVLLLPLTPEGTTNSARASRVEKPLRTGYEQRAGLTPSAVTCYMFYSQEAGLYFAYKQSSFQDALPGTPRKMRDCVSRQPQPSQINHHIAPGEQMQSAMMLLAKVNLWVSWQSKAECPLQGKCSSPNPE